MEIKSASEVGVGDGKTPAWFDADQLTASLLASVFEAARLEMAYFTAGVDVQRKADKSPVTIADREAENILLAGLAAAAPGVPVVAEEAASEGRLPVVGDVFFLVDALDGTRLFVKQRPEFSINIALVVAGMPVYGLIYAPAKSELYVTRSGGRSAYAAIDANADVTRVEDALWQTLTTKSFNPEDVLALNSLSAGDATTAMMKRLGVTRMQPMGSSLKFCHVAAGLADFYIRYGETNAWDTAAGHAILEAAGGCVLDLDGRPLRYGDAAPHFLNPAFIAAGQMATLRHRLGLA